MFSVSDIPVKHTRPLMVGDVIEAPSASPERYGKKFTFGVVYQIEGNLVRFHSLERDGDSWSRDRNEVTLCKDKTREEIISQFGDWFHTDPVEIGDVFRARECGQDGVGIVLNVHKDSVWCVFSVYGSQCSIPRSKITVIKNADTVDYMDEFCGSYSATASKYPDDCPNDPVDVGDVITTTLFGERGISGPGIVTEVIETAKGQRLKFYFSCFGHGQWICDRDQVRLDYVDPVDVKSLFDSHLHRTRSDIFVRFDGSTV